MTVTVKDVEYELTPLNVDQAEEIFKPGADPKKSTRELVAASLDITYAEVGKLPFAAYNDLVAACLDLNSIKAATPGEAPAAYVGRTSAIRSCGNSA
ncbi:MAG TPA: hypothetical protein VGD64_03375 [Acidisarcina sp.]